ncbi:hypothetical protein [Cryobacterium sp. Y62]|uniref:hypothetical protein n=1 Tax=Cryobacterium sp. Y62 TaxID=2048284 RepID=UPI000CE3B151|nr:hypothetical protein [Cryobacterium sp. Y62]
MGTLARITRYLASVAAPSRNTLPATKTFSAAMAAAAGVACVVHHLKSFILLFCHGYARMVN